MVFADHQKCQSLRILFLHLLFWEHLKKDNNQIFKIQSVKFPNNTTPSIIQHYAFNILGIWKIQITFF